MKNSIVVPFDLNTARKIKSGEIEGSVLINNGETKYECLNGVVFVHCIPFEGNECLLGITENPEKK